MSVSQHLSKLIQDAIESGDLARMKQVATEARKQARDDPNIAEALKALEAQIARLTRGK